MTGSLRCARVGWHGLGGVAVMCAARGWASVVGRAAVAAALFGSVLHVRPLREVSAARMTEGRGGGGAVLVRREHGQAHRDGHVRQSGRG